MTDTKNFGNVARNIRFLLNKFSNRFFIDGSEKQLSWYDKHTHSRRRNTASLLLRKSFFSRLNFEEKENLENSTYKWTKSKARHEFLYPHPKLEHFIKNAFNILLTIINFHRTKPKELFSCQATWDMKAVADVMLELFHLLLVVVGNISLRGVF